MDLPCLTSRDELPVIGGKEAGRAMPLLGTGGPGGACHEHGHRVIPIYTTGFRRRCRMGTSTRSFSDICVACLVGAIIAVSIISLGVVAWVALL